MTSPTDPTTPPNAPPSDTRPTSLGLWIGFVVIVALFSVVAVFAPRDPTVNAGGWAAMWLIAAAVLAVAEMLTATFFLLPFAVGAAAAGVLALLSVGVPTQIITFVVISVMTLWLLRRFAMEDFHGELLSVGATRYVGRTVLVIEPVSRLHGTGMVKLGTQDWRATTDGDEEIPLNAEVRVAEVRGTRLVVEPVK